MCKGKSVWTVLPLHGVYGGIFPQALSWATELQGFQPVVGKYETLVKK